MNNCYDSLNLYISDSTLTLEPLHHNPLIQRESLVISRYDCSVSLNAPPSTKLEEEERVMVYGLFGIIGLHCGDYLITISDRTKVGSILGHDIYQISRIDFIPIHAKVLKDDKQMEDLRYLDTIKTVLEMEYFYSTTTDITTNFQKISKGGSLWERADDRFFFNRPLVERLIQVTKTKPNENLSRFIIPIICGFCHVRQWSIRVPFTYSVISRRSRYRLGTRYHSRGVNEQGHVSNFVETEQILISENGTIHSYLQIRGSIPLYWEQRVSLGYKPKLVIHDHHDTHRVFKHHFNTLFSTYGPQIAINLINNKGYEQPLALEFSKHVSMFNNSNLVYVHFDFHHECRKMQWHRLSILMDQIKDQLTHQNYFKSHENRVIHQQNSIVRTNCIDCLDRTNVVQSILAKRILEIQFKELGILAPQGTLEDLKDFYKSFRNVWADHADAISFQYSGTGALKTDFTRTGKRTKVGALKDFSNSILRYIKNHYLDGARQDAMDLLTGNHVLNPNQIPKRPLFTLDQAIVIVSLVFTVLLLLYFKLFPSQSGSLFRYFFGIFWILFTVYLFKQFGDSFVSRPKLCPYRLHHKSA